MDVLLSVSALDTDDCTVVKQLKTINIRFIKQIVAVGKVNRNQKSTPSL